MTDSPMSLDPRDDAVMVALASLDERQSVWRSPRIKAAEIAALCGLDPSDIGNHLARWRSIELVDHSRHGWRLTKRGRMLMRAPKEAR
jgi:hypothetical protein